MAVPTFVLRGVFLSVCKSDLSDSFITMNFTADRHENGFVKLSESKSELFGPDCEFFSMYFIDGAALQP